MVEVARRLLELFRQFWALSVSLAVLNMELVFMSILQMGLLYVCEVLSLCLGPFGSINGLLWRYEGKFGSVDRPFDGVRGHWEIWVGPFLRLCLSL